jgi:(2Fe-2S) ferredoxin
MTEPTETSIFYVCVNTSCRSGGSVAILEALRAKLVGSAIEVREQICFGACWMGPNVVLSPNGTWYCGVDVSDLDEILAHVQGGEPVERLIDRSDPALCDQIGRILKSATG